MIFSRDQIKEIVKTFDKLSQAIYEECGLDNVDRAEDRRVAEHCASRIIAAEVGRCGPSGLAE